MFVLLRAHRLIFLSAVSVNEPVLSKQAVFFFFFFCFSPWMLVKTGLYVCVAKSAKTHFPQRS